MFFVEIQDEKRDGNESCVRFYCPNFSIKPENQWLLCTKTGGNNSSSNERLLQSLSEVNSTKILIGILKERVQWNAFFKYNGTQSNNCTERRNCCCIFNYLNCISNC